MKSTTALLVILTLLACPLLAQEKKPASAPASAPASVPAASRDWARWCGPNADGISPETGINKDWKNKPPKALWETPLNDRGHAGPSVADGKVYIVDHQDENDIVRAIDLKTGQDLWTFPYKEAKKEDNGHARTTPLIEDGRVYTVSRFGLVHCLDAKSGEKIWSCDLVQKFDGKLPT